MGQSLRHNPADVITQLSTWLSDPKSPRFWAPFALSIRGFAYEVMDERDLGRMDYMRGLRLYESLGMELGKEAVKRMESNVNFMRIRIKTLPPREQTSCSVYLKSDLFADLAKPRPHRIPGENVSAYDSSTSLTRPRRLRGDRRK